MSKIHFHRNLLIIYYGLGSSLADDKEDIVPYMFNKEPNFKQIHCHLKLVKLQVYTVL